MNVHLPPELEQFVAQLLQSGRYDTESEVICTGLWLLQDREELRKLRVDELRQKIAVGLEQLERGEYTVCDENSVQQLLERVRAGAEKQPAERNSANGP